MIKARIWKGYLLRMGLMAVLFTFFCAWFLYDGYVKYPRQAAIYQAFEKLRTDEGGRKEAAEVWNRKINEPQSEFYGYPASVGAVNPGDDKSANDIFVQRLIGFILLPVALLTIGWLVFHLGRWVSCDEKGLHTSWGVHVPFEAIQKLDKTLWAKKGIAVVVYRDPQGRTGGDPREQIDLRLTLDDWKFDRNPTRAILESVESHLSDEQIVGGDRESHDDESELAEPAPEQAEDSPPKPQ